MNRKAEVQPKAPRLSEADVKAMAAMQKASKALAVLVAAAHANAVDARPKTLRGWLRSIFTRRPVAKLTHVQVAALADDLCEALEMVLTPRQKRICGEE